MEMVLPEDHDVTGGVRGGDHRFGRQPEAIPASGMPAGSPASSRGPFPTWFEHPEPVLSMLGTAEHPPASTATRTISDTWRFIGPSLPSPSHRRTISRPRHEDDSPVQ